MSKTHDTYFTASQLFASPHIYQGMGAGGCSWDLELAAKAVRGQDMAVAVGGPLGRTSWVCYVLVSRLRVWTFGQDQFCVKQQLVSFPRRCYTSYVEGILQRVHPVLLEEVCCGLATLEHRHEQKDPQSEQGGTCSPVQAHAPPQEIMVKSGKIRREAGGNQGKQGGPIGGLISGTQR